LTERTQRPAKAFRFGLLGRKANGFHSAIRERRAKRCAGFRVAIMQNVAAWMKVAPGFLGRAAGDLLHPLLIRVPGDTVHAYSAALQILEKDANNMT
jgi:hypothetical protein